MSKKDIIVQELESVPEKEFDALLGFIHSLKSGSRPRSRPPGQICKRGYRRPALSVLRPVPDEAARPALVLATLTGNEVILCQITSQANQRMLPKARENVPGCIPTVAMPT